MQATETLKLILKKGDSLAGRFLLYNAMEANFTTFTLKRNPACPLCGSTPTITSLVDCYEAPAVCSI